MCERSGELDTCSPCKVILKAGMRLSTVHIFCTFTMENQPLLISAMWGVEKQGETEAS